MITAALTAHTPANLDAAATSVAAATITTIDINSSGLRPLSLGDRIRLEIGRKGAGLVDPGGARGFQGCLYAVDYLSDNVYRIEVGLQRALGEAHAQDRRAVFTGNSYAAEYFS